MDRSGDHFSLVSGSLLAIEAESHALGNYSNH